MPQQFDPTKPLVMAVFRTVGGHDLQPGVALVIAAKPDGPGQVEESLAKRLWASGIAAYADAFRPTPVETRQQEAERLVEMEETGNGWFSVRAPWLRKPERVRGAKAAQRAYDSIVAAGRPEDEVEQEQVEEPDDAPGLTGSGEVPPQPPVTPPNALVPPAPPVEGETKGDAAEGGKGD